MTTIIIISSIGGIALLVAVLEYGIFIPEGKGLPILMYHKVSPDTENGITISGEKIKKQLEYIQKKNYKTLTFSELENLLKVGSPLPTRALIITFDDAYENFTELAFPLLQSSNLKATVFVPVGFMGRTNEWDHGSDQILTAAGLRNLAQSGIIEIGIHSFLHRNYKDLDEAGMRNDLDDCFKTLEESGVPFVKVLAYPYGGYPKKDIKRKLAMNEIFREAGLEFALRIGNCINTWPLKAPYEIKRIDIKGTDNFFTFKSKLKKGRRKVFS